MAKITKFKPKSRKGAKKRLQPTSPKNGQDVKLKTTRTNHAHRLIGKTGERKLRAARKTVLSKIHQKFLKIISTK